MQRQLFSLTTKGPYHKAVGFAEPGEGSRSDVSQDETPILTGLTEELEFLLTDKEERNDISAAIEHESESNLIGNEHLLKILRELENNKALRETNSCGIQDAGRGHPPRN